MSSDREVRDKQYIQAYRDVFNLGNLVAKTLCDKYNIDFPHKAIDVLSKGALVAAISKDPFLVQHANTKEGVKEAINIITTYEDNR